MLLSRYVKLISSDGHEFIVKRDHALTSGTIKAMLSGITSIYLSVFIYLIDRSLLRRGFMSLLMELLAATLPRGL